MSISATSPQSTDKDIYISAKQDINTNTLKQLLVSSAFKNVMAMSPRTFQKRCIEQKQDSKARTDENQQTQTTDSAAASAPKEKTENIDLEKMLNPREMRLCKLVMEEKTSQEIATELGISRESLRVTKSRLLRKLDPDNNHHDLHTLLTDRYTSTQP